MTDIETQVNAVRSGIGLIDRSDVGKIAISGEDRFTWLQGMVSNDTGLITKAYTFFQTCVLDATGHILTDMSLVRMDGPKIANLAAAVNISVPEFVLADLPRANVSKILSLLERFIIMEDVELKDVSAGMGCFALQGKRASQIWDYGQGKEDDPLRGLWNHFKTMPADYTGANGFNAYFPMSDKEALLGEILQNGVVEVGPEAQEILRVEAGIPKYGMDMDETTLAPEAGLMATHISLTKGCYVGQEIVARIHSRGHTNRALTGLVFAEGDAPASGDKIVAEEDGKPRETGRITSVVAASPAINGRPIALGYVRHEHRAPGSPVQVAGNDRTRPASIVELPFYKPPH